MPKPVTTSYLLLLLKSKMLELMRLIPKNTLIDELSDWLPDKQEKYWKSIIG